MHDSLKDDYNLDALARVRPVGDGFDMFVTPRFVPVYANGYEVLSTRIVKRQLAQKDLFIDVGAHYGYYSLLAAEANPGIRIVSVEPIEDNLQVLQKNLALNGLGPGRATCIHAAVSSKAGRAQFCKSEASDNGSLYPHPSAETLDRIEVDTVSLDDIAGQKKAERIFVKTDTDGHELEVLKGFSKTLDACDDVTILLEMNPKMMKISGTSTEEIVAYLHGKGFRLFAIDDKEARFYPMDHVVNVAMMEARYEKSYYNVLCVRKAKALSVLFFSHAANLTGAERSLLDLVRGLSERGGVCTAVLPSPGPLQDELVKFGCAVYVPPDNAFLTRGWWWASMAPGPSKAALASCSEVVADIIIPEIRKISPDVIFSQTIVSPWGTLCAETLKIPHAISAREYGELDHNITFMLGFRNSMAALYNSSDAVFCISCDVKNTLFGDDPDQKIDVVYSSIRVPDGQVEAKGKGPKEEIQRMDQAVPTIGIFGAISPGKGQGDLIRASIELANRGIVCRCLLAGPLIDEAYADALRREINESGYSDRFIWAGFVNDPYALMRKVDLVVSCSKKEALGRTLIEGALLGKPIIYANSGGPREVFTHGEHGLAYEHGDSVSLANALESALQDREGTAARAQKAKEYVLCRFNDDTYAGKICDRLRQVVQQAGRSGRSRMAVGKLMMKSGIRVLSINQVQPKMLYSDDRGGFIESQSILSPEIPFGPFKAIFELPNRGYSCLSFNPTELYAVTLTIYDLVITAEDGTVLDKDCVAIETNGKQIDRFAWEFKTLDPQLVLRLNNRAKRVQILGELKKMPTRQLIANLAAVRRECEIEASAVDSSIFVDDGSGYGEENRQVVRMDRDPSANTFSVEFRLPPGGGAGRKVRWDPCEGRFCRCRIEKVETDGVYRGIARRNAWKSEDGWDEFMTGDPVYELDGDWGPATFIRMSGEFILPGADEVATRFMEELAEVRRECNAQCTAPRQEVCQGEGTLDALRRQFDDQQQELVRIQSSRISRWTRFIRLAGSWIAAHSASSGSQKP